MVTKSSAKAQGKIKVWQTDLFTKAANELAKSDIIYFCQQNGWEADISLLPTDAMAKLMAGVESGDLPDLLEGSQELPQLYGSDATVDVSAVVADLAKTNGAPVPLAQRGGNFKGKWWGIPWFMYADAFFARKDILDAGKKTLEDSQTFDERRAMALELSDPAKQLWGWGMTPKAATGDGDILARHVVNSFGGSISDESGEKVVFNSPETIAAMNWLLETYTDPKYKNMLPDGIFGWDGSANNNNFLGGKVIFTQNASSLYWAAKNQNNPYKDMIVLGKFPKGPKHDLMGGYPYYHMTFKKAKNPDAAIAIGTYMAQTPQVINRTKIATGQSWPVYQGQVDAKEVKDYIGADKNLEQLFKNCTHPSGWMVGWPASPNAAINAVSNQNLIDKCMEDVVNKKDKVETLVKQYHDRMVEVFSGYGLKQ
jgi:multiple sugar transport system substrate-binding protein